MNARLKRLIEWADEHEVDLDRVDVDLNLHYLMFSQDRETRRNFQNLKRSIDGFEETDESTPNAQLRKGLHIHHTDAQASDCWSVIWCGAYECVISHDCKPAGFKEDVEDAS